MKPIDRLQAESSVRAALEAMDGLNGPDFTSVLLEVMKRRTAAPSSLTGWMSVTVVSPHGRR